MKNKGIAAIVIGIIVIVLFGESTGFRPKSVAAEANIQTSDIDRFIQSRMDKNNIPGLAVAIVHDDQIVYSKGFGQSGNGEPGTSKHPFCHCIFNQVDNRISRDAAG